MGDTDYRSTGERFHSTTSSAGVPPSGSNTGAPVTGGSTSGGSHTVPGSAPLALDTGPPMSSASDLARISQLPDNALNLVTFMDNSEPIILQGLSPQDSFSQSLLHLEQVLRFESKYFPSEDRSGFDAEESPSDNPGKPTLTIPLRSTYPPIPVPQSPNGAPSDTFISVAHGQARDVLAFGALVQYLFPRAAFAAHFHRAKVHDIPLSGSLFAMFAPDWADRPTIDQVLNEMESVLPPKVPGATLAVPSWMPNVYQFLAEYKQQSGLSDHAQPIVETTKRILPVLEYLDDTGMGLVLPVFVEMLTEPTTRVRVVRLLPHVTKWVDRTRCRHTLLKLFLTWFENPDQDTLAIMADAKTVDMLVQTFGPLTFVQQLLGCYLDLFHNASIVRYRDPDGAISNDPPPSATILIENPYNPLAQPFRPADPFTSNPDLRPDSEEAGHNKTGVHDPPETERPASIVSSLDSSVAVVHTTLVQALDAICHVLGPILCSKHLIRQLLMVVTKTPAAVGLVAQVFHSLVLRFDGVFTLAQFNRLVAFIDGIIERNRPADLPGLAALVSLLLEFQTILSPELVAEEFNAGLKVTLQRVLTYVQAQPTGSIEQWWASQRLMTFLENAAKYLEPNSWESDVAPLVGLYFDIFIQLYESHVIDKPNYMPFNQVISTFCTISRLWGYDQIQTTFDQLLAIERILQAVYNHEASLSSLLDAKTRRVNMEVEEPSAHGPDRDGRSGNSGPGPEKAGMTLNSLTNILVHKPLKRSFSLNDKLFMTKLGQSIPPLATAVKNTLVSTASSASSASSPVPSISGDAGGVAPRSPSVLG
ncbi:hypothetical protein BJ085DRAFT_37454 [Dimargaris cristalligena]|uniref:Uncharacterized protein n=1 Tax=Dimargaris cristalligena TaxID=215637 RepID=A0A4P9ZML2_9FUNG|nr:hypothetical protein BJ085DRAFT_37454 [Dimargaris cristalligena]|eukprot:RKP34463.1 hypothetical protein BJ085DRAFT_37454 [Dimargaris cristalligena]